MIYLLLVSSKCTSGFLECSFKYSCGYRTALHMALILRTRRFGDKGQLDVQKLPFIGMQDGVDVHSKPKLNDAFFDSTQSNLGR